MRIVGGDTKSFYGRPLSAEPVATLAHSGIVDYEPTELVFTARSGTVLADVESTLADHGQMLAFEPPFFGDGGTLGGAVACGLSGPRRPYAGAVRDFVLGMRVVNGRGEDLSFGGQVMKNVAGYDVSRLMVGAMGTLGLILEVSLKVLPLPKAECTLMLEADAKNAIAMQNAWAKKASPISATCHVAGQLYVRLSGAEKGVLSARKNIGGEEMVQAARFWSDIRDHRHDFFDGAQPLWRISVPLAAKPLAADGDCLMEWSGGLRWLKSDAPVKTLRDLANHAGGQATLFRGGDRNDVFHPMDAGLVHLHRNLKKAFDPAGVFNPGRMYETL